MSTCLELYLLYINITGKTLLMVNLCGNMAEIIISIMLYFLYFEKNNLDVSNETHILYNIYFLRKKKIVTIFMNGILLVT